MYLFWGVLVKKGSHLALVPESGVCLLVALCRLLVVVEHGL